MPNFTEKLLEIGLFTDLLTHPTPDLLTLSSLGLNSSPATSLTALISAKPLTLSAEITGTTLTDRLRGTEGNDTIDGRAGRDYIYGFGGSDILLGGAGNDVLDGGGGAGDILDGGTGTDTASYIFSTNRVMVNLLAGTASGAQATGDTLISIENIIGSAFNDILTGDDGGNVLNGEFGNDTLSGENGFDLIYGGYGDDTLYGGDGRDHLFGDEGDDILDGGAGDDRLTGGDGNDQYIGSLGFDEVIGGHGDDTFIFDTAIATEFFGIFGGGAGMNSLVFRGAGQLDLAGARKNFYNIKTLIFDADGKDGQRSVLIDAIPALKLGRITRISEAATVIGRGEGFIDEIIIDFERNNFVTDLSRWTFQNWATSEDIIKFVGTDADNNITATSQDDIIYGRAGNDILNGGLGNDSLFGGNGNDTLEGEDGNDTLIGFNGDDEIYGGAGRDILNGGNGADILDGGAGVDQARYNGSTAAVQIDLLARTAAGGQAQGDTLISIENLFGSNHNDTLYGDSNNNKIFGHNGDDALAAGGGISKLYGGSGSDSFVLSDGFAFVMDFTDDVDQLDVSGYGFATLADALMNIDQVGEHARFRFDGDVLFILNTDADDLSNDIVI